MQMAYRVRNPNAAWEKKEIIEKNIHLFERLTLDYTCCGRTRNLRNAYIFEYTTRKTQRFTFYN